MKRKKIWTGLRKFKKRWGWQLQKRKLFYAVIVFSALLGMLLLNNLISRDNTYGVKFTFPPPEQSLNAGEENAALNFLCLVMGQEISGIYRDLSWRVNLWAPGASFTRYLTGLDLTALETILGAEIAGLSIFTLPVISEPVDVDPPPSGEDNPGEDSSGEKDAPVHPPTGEAVILIYHTHGTESFYPTSGVYFSENKDENVVVLGEALAEMLKKDYKIPVIHHRALYDLPRRAAYEKARPALRKLFEDHPEIQLVIDLHRDGVARELTTITLEGQEVGKILFVIGSGYEGWEKSFYVNLQLQQELEKLSPGLSKGIRRQPFIYNQDLHQHSVLVEVGGHLNSLEEARRTIPYLAEAVARVYRKMFEQ